ncbi:MAG: helix-turn-helix domain-containing protein [Acidobacteria bacterium]|nr:helix-turn-helix domain-containing protein [Acidobacteriota bacterium]
MLIIRCPLFRGKVTRELVHEGRSISEVARTFNVHPATIYRCLEDEQSL